ncbi:MAG: ABC transporter substrate-binding protein [Halobacterium sp.]
MTDTDNLSRRRFLEGTGAAAAAAAVAGCTGGSDSSDSATTEAATESDSSGGQTTEEQLDYDSSKRYRGVMVGTASTLDPIKANDTASGMHVTNIFDALMNYPDGEPTAEPLLATGYETANGGRDITFTLKEGATYNNGDEVTAQDVVYSFERLAASENSRDSKSILSTLAIEHETETVTNSKGEEEERYVPGTLGIDVHGDYEFTIHIEEPFYAVFELLAQTPYSLLPEGIVGDIEGYEGEMDYEEFARSDPVGAGPYELAEWEQASRISLDARDDYHGETPKNAGLDYTVFTETNPAYTYATTNVNADAPYIPSGKFDPELRNFEGTDENGRKYGTYGPIGDSGLTADYFETPTLSTFYNAFNCQAVPKHVRQAVAHVMNQQTINEQLINTPGKPAYFFTPPALFPGGPSAYEEHAKDYPYGYGKAQLDEARQIMEDEGYSSSNQYKLAFDMYSSLASSFGQDMYTLLRDKLQQAHIDLELRTADWSTFLNRGRNGNFEFFTLGWIAGYPGADKFTALLDPENTVPGEGEAYTHWTEDTGDAAAKAKQAWDRIENNFGPSEDAAEVRAEAYLEMEKANWEDAVLIPWQHGIDQGYSYEWVEAPRFGAMGPSRKKSHDVKIGDRGDYE